VKGVLGGVWGGALISGNDYNPITSRWLVRYTGFVQDPNNLAILMNLCAIACLSVAWMRRDRRVRMLMIGGVAASAGVVVVTGSRGGLIGIPLGLLVFSLFTGTRALMRISIFAAIGSWAALNAHFSSLDGLLSTFTKVVGGQDQSMQHRLAVWTRYQEEAGRSPIFGQGFGGYNQTALRGSEFNVSVDAARQATVDNSWLKLLLETGIIGVTFAALVALCFGTALIRAATTGAPRPVVAGVGAAMAIIAWRSVSTDVLDINPYDMIVPLLIAAALQLAQQIDPRIQTSGEVQRNHAKDRRQPSAGTAWDWKHRNRG
jgi:O-antigen ligase